MVETISWKENYLQLIDQTRLPVCLAYVKVNTIEDTFEAIKQLKVRGAPAIGVTAAYGLYLGMRSVPETTRGAFFKEMEKQIAYLSSARPTAVNLFWALQKIKADLKEKENLTAAELKIALLNAAAALHKDDAQRCQQMAEWGQAVIHKNARILTYCNTGALATGGIGTALGVIYHAWERGNKIEVFACETRPVLQGARLTVWELTAANIPVQLICDNMAASLMQKNKVDLVIVGADRIAADGSVANKIGTYNLAVLAQYHKIPFYVAAPFSTFDGEIYTGSAIPIETRSSDEIRKIFNQHLITVPDVDCWNPAFDVTPPELISGIITEKGIISPPYDNNIKKY